MPVTRPAVGDGKTAGLGVAVTGRGRMGVFVGVGGTSVSVAVGVEFGLTVGDAVGTGDGVGAAVGARVGTRVGVSVAVGVAVTVGVGVGVSVGGKDSSRGAGNSTRTFIPRRPGTLRASKTTRPWSSVPW
jgi:hypothetical protein